MVSPGVRPLLIAVAQKVICLVCLTLPWHRNLLLAVNWVWIASSSFWRHKPGLWFFLVFVGLFSDAVFLFYRWH